MLRSTTPEMQARRRAQGQALHSMHSMHSMLVRHARFPWDASLPACPLPGLRSEPCPSCAALPAPRAWRPLCLPASPALCLPRP